MKSQFLLLRQDMELDERRTFVCSLAQLFVVRRLLHQIEDLLRKSGICEGESLWIRCRHDDFGLQKMCPWWHSLDRDKERSRDSTARELVGQ